MIYRYKLVAAGGTFDRFHKGHEALLNKAFKVSEKVIIGVTSDNWVKRENKILKEIILPYNKRVSDLKNFLKSKGFLGREIIEKLENVYGPTVINGNVSALVVTRETRKGANEINRLRKNKGSKRLEIIECAFITSPDHYHISSTRIRLGQIDRKGNILASQPFGKHLPKNLRNALAKPIDTHFINVREIINKDIKPVIFIAVGDVVYQELTNLKAVPDIAIIDLKINRKTYKAKVVDFDYVVKNRPGTVSKTLIKILKKAIKNYLKNKKPQIIKVIGEEDLAVIPAILASPLESVIVYGQPKINKTRAGVVRVLVTEEKKKWVVDLLKRFQ